ncbi:MAG: hypothetical protein VCC01_12255 [Candidatus Hydrogenedentota bacterium]
MNNASAILAILLVIAIMGVSTAYLSDRNTSSTELETRYDSVLEEMRLEHVTASAELEASLARVQMDWELKHARLQSSLREALLNTEHQPDEVVETVDTFISQETYGFLNVGMRYEDVVTILGREGENRLNMMDADGSGISSYVWHWINDEGIEVHLTVTFEDLKLSKNHYPAFKL